MCACVSDLSLGDLWLPHGAQHHIGLLHLLLAGILAVESAQGVGPGDPVSLCDPGHRLGRGYGFSQDLNHHTHGLTLVWFQIT